MITTGIIREINKSSNPLKYKGNLYGVEISIFKTPVSSMDSSAIVNCVCALPGGMYNSYAVGDVVFIGFVDNEMAQPVILGRIYRGLEDVCRTYGYLDSLKVKGSTILSNDTKIGDITYKNLSDLVSGFNNVFTKVKSFNGTITVGGNDPVTVVHNLNNKAVVVQLFNTNVAYGVTVVDENSIRITFGTPPAVGSSYPITILC